MSTSDNFVEDQLALELIDTNLYRSTKPLWHPPGARGIFGGAVIAQALSAAMKTVDKALPVHSLHSYFVLAYCLVCISNSSGDSTIPVIYSVELVRDGRSFATRTVRSLQRGAVIFVLTASFHRPEPSPLAHGMPSPIHLVPPPESMPVLSPTEYAQSILQLIKKVKDVPRKHKLPAIVARARENGEELVKSISEEFASRPIDLRYIEKECITPTERTRNPTETRHYAWFKANGTISDDPRSHAIALAYASDHQLLSTSIRSHEGGFDFKDIAVMVSLDHIMYFHEEIRADDWLLYEAMSPWTGASRGLNIGYIFNRDGRHVATCVQEGLLRLNSSAKERGSKL